MRIAVLTVILTTAPLMAAPPVRVTTDGTFKQHLQWSPDGTRFLFTRIHQGKMALWTVNADGSDLKRLMPGLATPHFGKPDDGCPDRQRPGRRQLGGVHADRGRGR